jgi:hypothetical protein
VKAYEEEIAKHAQGVPASVSRAVGVYLSASKETAEDVMASLGTNLDNLYAQIPQRYQYLADELNGTWGFETFHTSERLGQKQLGRIGVNYFPTRSTGITTEMWDELEFWIERLHGKEHHYFTNSKDLVGVGMSRHRLERSFESNIGFSRFLDELRAKGKEFGEEAIPAWPSSQDFLTKNATFDFFDSWKLRFREQALSNADTWTAFELIDRVGLRPRVMARAQFDATLGRLADEAWEATFSAAAKDEKLVAKYVGTLRDHFKEEASRSALKERVGRTLLLHRRLHTKRGNERGYIDPKDVIEKTDPMGRRYGGETRTFAGKEYTTQEMQHKIHEQLKNMPTDEERLLALHGILTTQVRSMDQLEEFIRTYQKYYDAVDPKMRETIEGIYKDRVGSGSTQFGQEMKEVPHLPNLGELEGAYLPKAIVDQLIDYQRQINSAQYDFARFLGSEKLGSAMRSYRTTLTWGKFGLTAPWPSFHFRNMYNDMVQAMVQVGMVASNPRTLGHAMNIMWGKDGYLELQIGKKPPTMGVQPHSPPTFGEVKIPYSQIREEIFDYGIFMGAKQLFEHIDVDGVARQTLIPRGAFGRAGKKVAPVGEIGAKEVFPEVPRFLGKGFKAPGPIGLAGAKGYSGAAARSQISAQVAATRDIFRGNRVYNWKKGVIESPGIFSYFERASELRESFGRVALYMHYRQRGISPEVAAMSVNEIFFDYAENSTFDRNIRLIFPFWIWNKKNLALQFKQAGRNPGPLSAVMKISNRDYGPHESQLTEYQMADTKLGIYTPKGDRAMALARRMEKQGKLAQFPTEGSLSLILGIDFPLNAAIDLLPGSDFGKNWIGMLTPPLSLAMNLTMGWNVQINREFDSDTRRQIHGAAEIVEQMPKFWREWLQYQEYEDGYKTVNALRYRLMVDGMWLSRFVQTHDRFGKILEKAGGYEDSRRLTELSFEGMTPEGVRANYKWWFKGEDPEGEPLPEDESKMRAAEHRIMQSFFYGLRVRRLDLKDTQRAMLWRNLGLMEDEAVRRGEAKRHPIIMWLKKEDRKLKQP